MVDLVDVYGTPIGEPKPKFTIADVPGHVQLSGDCDRSGGLAGPLVPCPQGTAFGCGETTGQCGSPDRAGYRAARSGVLLHGVC